MKFNTFVIWKSRQFLFDYVKHKFQTMKYPLSMLSARTILQQKPIFFLIFQYQQIRNSKRMIQKLYFQVMNPQKFKDWLIKINNANLEKPSENAYLQGLTSEVQDLSVQVHHLLNQRDRKMVQVEDQINNKTSQLMELENRMKEGWYNLQKKAQKQKDRRVSLIKTQTKQIMEEAEVIKRKFRTIQIQIQQKNRTYLELLTAELVKLKQSRTQSSLVKAKQQKIYEQQLKKRIRKADQILESQEKDLLLIDKYQKQLLSRCEDVQKQYESRLQQKWQRSQQKQKLLLRKLEVLISQVDTD